MKLPSFTTVSLVTLAGLAGTVSADSRCIRLEGAGSYVYEITIEDVPRQDIKRVCNSLWNNLKGYLDCMVYRPNGCEEGYYDGDLYWYFTTSIVCSSEKVQSAFYGATKNNWGHISCI
ncbi:hypothetical protein QIS74_13284 [Colletotrichum tabaci]|uniref:Small secreted protein n=1 Tax=Colletotrichum tabaci TaxID=1209068 RepID=A0AAV9SU79_9PEZI